jgi:hypothetical protein
VYMVDDNSLIVNGAQITVNALILKVRNKPDIKTQYKKYNLLINSILTKFKSFILNF